MLLSWREGCGSEKSKLIKEQKTSGLLSQLGI